MTVEKTLLYMQLNNPERYSNRKQCLNDLFCKGNNEFIWINGELIPKKLLHYSEFYHNISKIIGIQNIEYNNCEFKDNKKDIQWDFPEPFSYLYNYPLNIKQDWYEALIETNNYILNESVKCV